MSNSITWDEGMLDNSRGSGGGKWAKEASRVRIYPAAGMRHIPIDLIPNKKDSLLTNRLI